MVSDADDCDSHLMVEAAGADVCDVCGYEAAIACDKCARHWCKAHSRPPEGQER